MKQLITLAALAAMVSGCTGSPQQSPADHTWNSDFGKWRKDPVAGKLILRRYAMVREYQGVTYYFQNQIEAREFESDPAAYVAPPESTVSTESREGSRHLTNVHSR